MNPRIKQQLEEQLERLDDPALLQVLSFASGLAGDKRLMAKRGKMQFNWIGQAAAIEPTVDSVTLQHRISQWRG